MDSKRILFLLRRPPYAGAGALEALEVALVAGVFDQQVSVLFKDDGVYQLLSEQDGALLGGRTVSRVLSALPEYDIDALYVCARSLAERSLDAADLALPVTVLTVTEQRDLLSAQQLVLND